MLHINPNLALNRPLLAGTKFNTKFIDGKVYGTGILTLTVHAYIDDIFQHYLKRINLMIRQH